MHQPLTRRHSAGSIEHLLRTRPDTAPRGVSRQTPPDAITQTPEPANEEASPLGPLVVTPSAAADPNDFTAGPDTTESAPLLDVDQAVATRPIDPVYGAIRPPLTLAQLDLFETLKESIERGEANFRHTLQSMTQTDAEAVLTAGGLDRTPMVWHLMNSLDCNASRMLQQALETCPAAVTARTFDGQVALHLAASHANPEALALILQRTRQVDVRDDEGRYPLYELAQRARYLERDKVIECVKLLIEAGADWALTTDRQRDAAGACAHDKDLCNLVMGLPTYTTCLLEILQANPQLKPADVLRLKNADLPPSRMNLIDLERTKRGLQPIYQADRDNVEDQRRCRALVARRSR